MRGLLTTVLSSLVMLVVVPVAQASDSVYWSDYSSNRILSASLAGGAGAALSTTGATTISPFGTDADPQTGRIYWPNQNGGKISYAALDGSGGGDLNTTGAPVSQASGVAIDPLAGRIYWANQGAATIGYAALDGSGGGTLNTAGAPVLSAPAIDPVARRLLWSGGSTIRYANLDGSGGVGTLSTAGASPSGLVTGLAVDAGAGKVYWVDQSTSKVSFANLDGSGGGGDLSTSGGTLTSPEGASLDPVRGRLYTGSFSTNQIFFVNLDGSGGGALDTTGVTPSGPSFPIVLRAPSGTGAPTIGGTAVVGASLTCSQGTWSGDLLGAFFYASPQGFAYQWVRDGSDIAGATSSSFVADAPGDYTCRVTASNRAGSTSQTSAAKTVAPNPAPGPRPSPLPPAPPATLPVAPRLAISHLRVPLKGDHVELTIRCRGPVGARCRGTLTLAETTGTHRFATAGRRARYGEAKFDVAAGANTPIRATATATLLKNLRPRGYVIGLAQARFTIGDDTPRSVARRVTIKQLH